MNQILQNDLLSIDQLITKAIEQGVDFLKKIDSIPTSTISISKNQSDLEKLILPEQGCGGIGALDAFNNLFRQYIVSSSGPRYWGYITGGATPASIMGDILASIYDQNTQATSGYGDVSAIIEMHTIKLLLDLLKLPKHFTGSFVTGTTMANFSSLAVARQWYGHQLNYDIASNGINGLKPLIFSGTPHSSILKSLAMLGFGRNNLVSISTISKNREAINVKELDQRLSQYHQLPSIVILNAGTANTADFDNFYEVIQLKKKYQFWIHIDAAFGGFASCSPKYRHLLEGWEAADSISIDCHKWLNVPYESACFFIKKDHIQFQVDQFKNSNAPYLLDLNNDLNFMNMLPENSRRLKALPALFSLLAYGRDGYKDIVENCIRLAQIFGNFIKTDPNFELLAEVKLNIVCFSITGKLKTEIFLNYLNKTGIVFMTPTKLNSRFGLRAAFVNYRTTDEDINLVCRKMVDLSEQYLYPSP